MPAEAQRAIVGDYHTHGGPNQIGEGQDFSGQHATMDILGNSTTGDEQKAGDIWEGREGLREAELELARQAETAYRRLSATGSPKKARARQRDAHLQGRQAAFSAAGHRSQTLRLSSSSPTTTRNSLKQRPNNPAET